MEKRRVYFCRTASALLTSILALCLLMNCLDISRAVWIALHAIGLGAAVGLLIVGIVMSQSSVRVSLRSCPTYVLAATLVSWLLMFALICVYVYKWLM